MRDYCYRVTFEINNRYEDVFASCKRDAIILAKAEQIKKGNQHDDIKKVQILD